MTQRITDAEVRECGDSAYTRMRSLSADLLSLRAAVRRWIAAKQARTADLRRSGVGGHAPHCGSSLDDLKNAEQMLIAEMAGTEGSEP